MAVVAMLAKWTAIKVAAQPAYGSHQKQEHWLRRSARRSSLIQKRAGRLKQNRRSVVVKIEEDVVFSRPKIKGRNGMCDRCVELDKKIEHFHRLAARFTDQALLSGIRELIERAEVEKAALHPEQAA
jgi:hypothetical protein